MYKILNDKDGNIACLQRLFDTACIPFDPANTDYTQFKKDLQDGVELQDAEGQVMTKEQVEEFMRSLP